MITRYITEENDRWDLIAFKAYGDATKIQGIIDANPAVPIRAVLPAGLIINVPVIDDTQAESATATNLPPWKR